MQRLLAINRGRSGQGRVSLESVTCWAFERQTRGCKLAVISVVGLPKTGKTRLLNYIIRYLKSGGQGDWIGVHTPDEPLTGFRTSAFDGIAYWSNPFIRTRSNGDKVAIVLLDINCSKFKEYDRIIGLAMLLSSVVIVNTVGELEVRTVVTQISKSGINL